MVPDADLSSLTNTELVEGIQRKDYRIVNEFYRRFHYRLRAVVFRQGIQYDEMEDILHDTIFDAIERIQAGALRDPRCLSGYLATIARRNTIQARNRVRRFDSIDVILSESMRPTSSDAMTRADVILSSAPSPEDRVLINEKRDAMIEALAHMKPRDVEILTRFYLKEQSAVEIQQEMGLTDTQFRLLKSRAKGIFAETAAKIRHIKERRQRPLAA